MKRAIAFIRLSTEEQAEEGRAGVLRQRNDIAVAAMIHDLKVVQTLEAIGLGGTKVLESPVFKELCRTLPAVDGVIVSALDRLVRPGMLGDLAVFDPCSNRDLISQFPVSDELASVRHDFRYTFW
jgi:DNA invertase Pin-like site-specific DNA recombinase